MFWSRNIWWYRNNVIPNSKNAHNGWNLHKKQQKKRKLLPVKTQRYMSMYVLFLTSKTPTNAKDALLTWNKKKWHNWATCSKCVPKHNAETTLDLRRPRVDQIKCLKSTPESTPQVNAFWENGASSLCSTSNRVAIFTGQSCVAWGLKLLHFQLRAVRRWSSTCMSLPYAESCIWWDCSASFESMACGFDFAVHPWCDSKYVHVGMRNTHYRKERG